ncbi:hypothetical protein PISMIDRAFT_16793 [Pisolithus microcarpus 441]|uniref:Uncharacterized protein n=2 Tax=Pisolithus microcarpus 441 TaxID=765257 RepID=A0A0C9YY40_9AGAM|nr:hypothetical protein PISMIDRAFT_16793 [Pisolithus microcarpus 441]
MAPDTNHLWCVCHKYCKGIRRQLNTPNTWRQHLHEAAEDEVEAIQLAAWSDLFRKFLHTFTGSSANSSGKQTNGVSSDASIGKRPCTLPHSSPTPGEDSAEAGPPNDDLPADDHPMYPPNDDLPADDQPIYPSDNDLLVDPAHNNPRYLPNSNPPPDAPTNNPPPPTRSAPLSDLNLEELASTARLPKLQWSMGFIQAIRNASLDDGIGLMGEDLGQLRNPPKEPLCMDDRYTELALSMFIALEHSSEATYEKIWQAIRKCFPEAELPSFHQTECILSNLSGVMSIVNNMCINSCVAYIGPFSNLNTCPECNEPCYNQVKLHRSDGRIKHPCAVFHMIPIAPQLQSLWRHPEKLQNNNGLVDTYDDVFCGYSYLSAVAQNKIQPDDTLLMISIDGAQLYDSKESDCWIYIWIVLELSPDHRYRKKHVLLGTIIPGPKKLKIIDSFLFPGLHHLSAVQCEGLRIWDASHDCDFISRLFLFLVCADGPGLLTLSNFVGHQGKNGCWMLCPMKGCHKPGASQYYPVILKPDNYNVPGCDHPDVDIRSIRPGNSHSYIEQLTYLLSSRMQHMYEAQCLETGIVGPSILLGLQPELIQGIPEIFSSEMMHLSSANMAMLWLDLWWVADGKIKVIINGTVHIAEVRCFARLVIKAAGYFSDDDDDDEDTPGHLQFDDIALVMLYSHPHPHLLDNSYGVLASCTKLGEASLQVVKISSIQAVVAMVPHHPVVNGVPEDRYFLVEKTGMEIAHFGMEENNDE